MISFTEIIVCLVPFLASAITWLVYRAYNKKQKLNETNLMSFDTLKSMVESQSELLVKAEERNNTSTERYREKLDKYEARIEELEAKIVDLHTKLLTVQELNGLLKLETQKAKHNFMCWKCYDAKCPNRRPPAELDLTTITVPDD